MSTDTSLKFWKYKTSKPYLLVSGCLQVWRQPQLTTFRRFGILSPQIAKRSLALNIGVKTVATNADVI